MTKPHDPSSRPEERVFADNGGEPCGLGALDLTCTSFGRQAEIEAFWEGKWRTVAIVNGIGGLDAEEVAQTILRALVASK